MQYKYCWYCHRVIPYTYTICPYCHAQQYNYSYQSMRAAAQKTQYKARKWMLIDLLEFIIYFGALYFTASHFLLFLLIFFGGAAYCIIWGPIKDIKRFKQMKPERQFNEVKQYNNPHHPIRNFEVNTLHLHKSYHQLYTMNEIISGVLAFVGIIDVLNELGLGEDMPLLSKIQFLSSTPTLSIIIGLIMVILGFCWSHWS